MSVFLLEQLGDKLISFLACELLCTCELIAVEFSNLEEPLSLESVKCSFETSGTVSLEQEAFVEVEAYKYFII